MKNIKLIALLSIVLLSVTDSFSQIVMPIPIPIGRGSASPDLLIALWIAFDLIFLSVFLIKILIWFILRGHLKKNRWTFFEYTIYIDDVFQEYVQNWNTTGFIIVNGIGVAVLVLIYLIKWIIEII